MFYIRHTKPTFTQEPQRACDVFVWWGRTMLEAVVEERYCIRRTSEIVAVEMCHR
jgi:hypothetical protein